MKDLSLPLLMAMISLASALVVGTFTTLLKWYLDRQAKEAEKAEAARQIVLQEFVRKEVGAVRSDLIEKMTSQNTITSAAVTQLGTEIARDRETTARMWRAVLGWQKKFEERFVRLEEKGQETRILVDRIKVGKG